MRVKFHKKEQINSKTFLNSCSPLTLLYCMTVDKNARYSISSFQPMSSVEPIGPALRMCFDEHTELDELTETVINLFCRVESQGDLCN